MTAPVSRPPYGVNVTRLEERDLDPGAKGSLHSRNPYAVAVPAPGGRDTTLSETSQP